MARRKQKMEHIRAMSSCVSNPEFFLRQVHHINVHNSPTSNRGTRLSLLEAGTVLRLVRDAWSMVKCLSTYHLFPTYSLFWPHGDSRCYTVCVPILPFPRRLQTISTINNKFTTFPPPVRYARHTISLGGIPDGPPRTLE